MISDYSIWRGFGFSRRAALANALISAEPYPPMPFWRQECETAFQFIALSLFLILRAVIAVIGIALAASS